jgi:hypothetical protein
MKVLSTIDNIAKAIVGAGGLAITALQPTFGADKWFVGAVAVYGAISIYFTKNLGTITDASSASGSR